MRHWDQVRETRGHVSAKEEERGASGQADTGPGVDGQEAGL